MVLRARDVGRRRENENILDNLVALVSAAAQSALAQTVNYLAPPDGLTIKDVAIENDGWAFITFQENPTDLNNCSGANWGGITYPHVLWVEFSGTYQNAQAAKLSYGTALAALLTGKKLVGVNWRQVSYWCDAFAIRLGP